MTHLPVFVLFTLGACTGDPSDSADTASPATLGLTLRNVSTAGDLHTSDGETHDIKLAPGIVLVHDASFALFTEGALLARAALEPFGEDGDPTALLADLEGDPAVRSVGWLTARDATSYDAAPMFPGEYATENVEVHSGDKVTVAAMFGESNDTVVAALGFDPFDGAALVEGNVALALYDLGTEADQEPGLGADQATRQSEPGQGEPENEPVTKVVGTSDGFAWPAVASFATLEAVAR